MFDEGMWRLGHGCGGYGLAGLIRCVQVFVVAEATLRVEGYEVTYDGY